MAHARKKLGDWGELVATTHLESLGFRVVARNWRCVHGEIDLVVEAKGVWRFVEVKTRRGGNAGIPEQNITPRKAQKLLNLALTYLGEQELDVDWQIDMVAIQLDSKGKLVRCDHIENIVVGW
jgi:putative endonuclease